MARSQNKRVKQPGTYVKSQRALARVRGLHEALQALETMPDRQSIESQHLYHAIRASFLNQLGQEDEARNTYRHAAELAPSEAERGFLRGLGGG